MNVCLRAAVVIALSVSLGALASPLAAQDLILYDGFDYPTTASTTTTPPADGDRSLSGVVLAGAPLISFANAGGYQNAMTTTLWSPININAGGTVYNTAGDVDIVSGGLTYSGLASSVGNSVTYGGNGYSPRLIFSPITSAGGFPDAAVPGPAQGVTGGSGAANVAAANAFDGNLFYSALIRVNSLSGTADVNGDPIMHFHAVTTQGTTPASAHFAGAYVKPDPLDANKFFLGVTKGESVNGTAATFGTTSYTLGSTLLIVGQWDFNPNVDVTIREGNDVARLYVNPTTLGGSEGSSGATVITDIGGASDDLPLGSVALTSIVLSQRRDGVPNVTVDEVRVGKTFASVTPPSATMDDADFDGDGDVDGADFLTWQRNLGGNGGLAQGDANNSGTITDADLAIWRAQFGPAAVAAAAAIPEPASVCLAAAALLAAAGTWRRKL